ncbi:hypothetical protein FHS29_004026 [Saccharothrix tamanrassetensis]|uniref:DUF3592 domain-containing protein n=1 Tax=Saccharothrix tamanrassetensis TaxID=1051531 RepID=A0A841CJ08_9PSEU|nr:hypothetical protein [Saccharothrix tamanrassetensis]MBB5957431.1 hypothetical protein [Saccharothrix tamanrassetensis]
MNTVDPAQVRHDRDERRRGSPVLLVGAVVASAATLVLGYLAGIGFGELVEQFRTVAVDSVFDDRGDGDPPYRLVWGTFGFLGCILAGHLAAGAARRYQGRPSAPVFPISLASAGHTVGTWVSSRGWRPPLAVGTQVDPIFHRDEAWGLWAWVMYYADRWLPALLLVVTSLVVLQTIRLARRYADMVEERDRLLARGRRVPADVVDVKLRISTNSETGRGRAVGAIVTVCFVDLAGVRHWVIRRTSDVGVVTGAGLAEVLFDPERPTHDRSIFVALRRHPSPGDWLPAD